MWGQDYGGFEGEEQDFKLNTQINREPMKLGKDRGEVVRVGCSGDDACC